MLSAQMHGKGTLVYPNGEKYEVCCFRLAVLRALNLSIQAGGVHAIVSRFVQHQSSATAAWHRTSLRLDSAAGQTRLASAACARSSFLRFACTHQGDWQWGKRHGFGRMIFPDGSRYTGEWVDDRV